MMPWSPSFRTIAGEFGSPRIAGSPTSRMAGSFPSAPCPAEIVHSIAGDSAGNLWISHQDQGLFHLLAGTRGRTDSLGQAGAEGLGVYTLLPDPSQGGLWLGFYQGRRGVFQGRSGPRIVRQAPTGWARAVSAAFNSIGTVRSGPQPRAG